MDNLRLGLRGTQRTPSCEDDSITASPTAENANDSIHSQRSRRREKRKLGENIEATQPRQTGGIEVEEHVLYQADRLDCLRARQELSHRRAAFPATNNFMTLESLVMSQQLPAEEEKEEEAGNESDTLNFITNTELINFCDDVEQQASILAVEQPRSIVDTILHDFCSSPGYVEESVAIGDISPYFRFRKRKIKTYSRSTKRKQVVETTGDEDDRMSCSSELSVQEDRTAPAPSKPLDTLDANSSQRICENLLNLSAYFTQNSENVNKSPSASVLYITAEAIEGGAASQAHNVSIDLPSKEKEEEADSPTAKSENKSLEIRNNDSDESPSKIMESLEAELKVLGYTFESDDEEVVEKSKGCAEDSLFTENSRIQASLFKDFSLVNSPIKRLEKDPSPAPEADKAVDKQAKADEMIDWLDGDCSFFENFTTQPTNVDAGKENEDVNKALCPVKKEVIVTEIATLKLNTLIEIECVKGSQNVSSKPATDKIKWEPFNFDENIFTEWQPEEVPKVAQFRTASNKAITMSEEAKRRAAALMADAMDCNELDFEEEMKPAEVSKTAEFRTPSNRAIVVSEEAERRAAVLMADVETFDFEDDMHPADVPQMAQFRTASNKVIALSEEAKKRAVSLMAGTEASTSKQVTEIDCDFYNHKPIELDNVPEKVQFRTASNKVIALSEEARERAASLMADTEASNQKPIELDDVPGSSKVIQVSDETPSTSRPQQSNQSLCNSLSYSILETPTTTTTESFKSSLSQLAARSPLDVGTKTSIIARRNLLSLSRRRITRRGSDNDALNEPLKPFARFASTSALTSTPLANRPMDMDADLKRIKWEESDTSEAQGTPSPSTSKCSPIQHSHKRQPIRSSTSKNRSLGLRRTRNK